MCRLIPVYLRDETTQEYRAQVPGHPGLVLRAPTLHDLRRKLRAVEYADDEPEARSGLVPALATSWQEPYDPNADTVFYVKV